MPAATNWTIAESDPHAFERIVAVLLEGRTVLIPTDTVYGVGAVPSIPGATDRVFALKERSLASPLAVLVADVEQARTLVERPSPEVAGWMEEFWPGPLTLVLPRSTAAASLALGGPGDTIGVRCPDHDLVRAVAAEVGPIATTSANRHGAATPTTAAAAAAALVGPVDLVVDGGERGTLASTVVDATWVSWRLLREGAIPIERLRAGRP